MKRLFDTSRLSRILCIGAHSDDIEIGCGATMLRLLRENPRLEVTWVVFCGSAERGDEAKAAANRVLRNHQHHVITHDFRDAHLPGDWLKVKAAMAELREPTPDLVFTHRDDDRHQDHRLLGELAGQTFRDHVVMHYEIPKFDADLGRPNVYAPASLEDLEAKCRLLDAFASQRDKHWFDDDTFRGLARIRGLECASDTGYAEGFYCGKVVL
jgi:LmbE family N-acetylglucosaminyl deacetylase